MKNTELSGPLFASAMREHLIFYALKQNQANSHINIYESLKILVIFLFRHHTNSVN